MNPNPNDMVMIGMINLSEHTDIYEALKTQLNNKNNLQLIFDDESKCVWINWYEGVLQ